MLIGLTDGEALLSLNPPASGGLPPLASQIYPSAAPPPSYPPALARPSSTASYMEAPQQATPSPCGVPSLPPPLPPQGSHTPSPPSQGTHTPPPRPAPSGVSLPPPLQQPRLPLPSPLGPPQSDLSRSRTPAVPSHPDKKRKRRTKDKKDRLNNKNWAEGVRETILSPHIPRYLDALAKDAWNVIQDIVMEVCAEYHAKIPWTMPVWEEPEEPLPAYDPKNPPVWPQLSDEEEKQRSAILTERNAAIHRWLDYRARKTPGYRHRSRASTQNPYDRYMMKLTGLSPKGTKKALQTIQQYVIENPELVVAATKAFEDAKALGGGSVLFRGKVITKKNINWVMDHVKPAFDALAPEEKQGYWDRSHAFAHAEKEEWERLLKAPPKRDAQSIHLAWDQLESFVEPVLRGIVSHLDAHVVILVGGRFPAGKGEPITRHYAMGKNKQNVPFSHWDQPRFQKDVLGFFADYLETAWTPAERAAVALDKDDDTMDVDGVPGPLGRTRFTEEEIAGGDKSDDEEDLAVMLYNGQSDNEDEEDEPVAAAPKRRKKTKAKAKRAATVAGKHATSSPHFPPIDPRLQQFDPFRVDTTFDENHAPPIQSGHLCLAWKLKHYEDGIIDMTWGSDEEKAEFERLMRVWRTTHYVDPMTGIFVSHERQAVTGGSTPSDMDRITAPLGHKDAVSVLASKSSQPSAPRPRPKPTPITPSTRTTGTPAIPSPTSSAPVQPSYIPAPPPLAVAQSPVPQASQTMGEDNIRQRALAPPASAKDTHTGAWLVETWPYIAHDFGMEWLHLLVSFTAWEEANSFARGKPLPVLNTRPKEVQHWISHARWARGDGGEPGPKNLAFAQRIIRTWWEWYRRLCPGWRVTRPDGTLDVCEEMKDGMGKLQCCGINGVFNLVVILKWAKDGLVADAQSPAHAALNERWLYAVRDLTRMLQHMTKDAST
ncbi:hypothetical protein BD626DRAFT_573957 [Schizophyllum amplum]|uniref:Uncharacterized protein n=1 Tax=Schizophyllum amplum TaxID=97359 RepID=A0A550BZJ4_9AGAR|nr:hypothetical protein BD626DRAFT_573957 [Auriculariopsis ampla]